MMSSSERGHGGANPYARFIPREELEGFSSWQPGAFGDVPTTRGMPPVKAPVDETQRAAEQQGAVQAARQAGYQDGYRDGLAALENFKQSFAAQATAQVGRLIEGLDREFAALEGQIAQAVTATAVTLARQVLRSELQVRPELVAGIAAEAVNAVLLSARQITLAVHPDDLPLVAEGAGEVLQARGARLVPDGAVERGGCRVESDLGAVDARIASRWAQAASALGSEEPWTE